MIKRPLHLSHEFLAEVLDPTALAVDVTMGNGHDTAFLAKHAGQVVAFDVQNQALEKTAARLAQQGLDNVELVLAGHEQVDQYVTDPIRAAIFNLGYLPSADKTIITQATTTLVALEKILKLLEVCGRVAIMVYYGHAGGDREKDAVLDFVSQLDQAAFTVMLYQALNQVNTPPFLIMIEKLA